MRLRETMMAMAAVAVFGAAGCGESERLRGVDEAEAERAAEAAEQRTEDRLEARGVDPLSEEIREEVAGERAELAADVGADPEAMDDEEARTAAGHLAAGEGDAYETE